MTRQCVTSCQGNGWGMSAEGLQKGPLLWGNGDMRRAGGSTGQAVNLP
jgi:hypothetical protein